MTIGDLVFLLTLLATLVLLLRIGLFLVQGRKNQALKGTKILSILLLVYLVALVSAGLTSKSRTLPLGQSKCFDEWCLSLDGVTHSTKSLVLHGTISNRGHRSQRPDSPKLFLVSDGKPIALQFAALSERVSSDSPVPFAVDAPLPPGVEHADLLVTEGGSPSLLVIGDENSPFHAKATWRVFPTR